MALPTFRFRLRTMFWWQVLAAIGFELHFLPWPVVSHILVFAALYGCLRSWAARRDGRSWGIACRDGTSAGGLWGAWILSLYALGAVLATFAIDWHKGLSAPLRGWSECIEIGLIFALIWIVGFTVGASVGLVSSAMACLVHRYVAAHIVGLARVTAPSQSHPFADPR